jgi:hypothetical protein
VNGAPAAGDGAAADAAADGAAEGAALAAAGEGLGCCVGAGVAAALQPAKTRPAAAKTAAVRRIPIPIESSSDRVGLTERRMPEAISRTHRGVARGDCWRAQGSSEGVRLTCAIRLCVRQSYNSSLQF